MKSIVSLNCLMFVLLLSHCSRVNSGKDFPDVSFEIAFIGWILTVIVTSILVGSICLCCFLCQECPGYNHIHQNTESDAGPSTGYQIPHNGHSIQYSYPPPRYTPANYPVGSSPQHTLSGNSAGTPPANMYGPTSSYPEASKMAASKV